MQAAVINAVSRVVITINDRETVDVSPELAEVFAEAVLRAAEQARGSPSVRECYDCGCRPHKGTCPECGHLGK